MSNTLTDPPKANKVKVKKEPGRDNDFRIDIDGQNFIEGQEYSVKFQFRDCTTDPISLHYESSIKLTTGTYIEPNTDCIHSAYEAGAPTCNVIWVNPPAETDQDVEVKWENPPSQENIGFLARIINFLKRLFGGN